MIAFLGNLSHRSLLFIDVITVTISGGAGIQGGVGQDGHFFSFALLDIMIMKICARITDIILSNLK